MSDLASITLAALRSRITGVFPSQIRSAIDSLSDEQIWWRPNEESNSIGNLMLHLAGSVQLYLNVIQSKPGRVRAAFIRDVTPDLRDQGVAKIIEEAKTAGVEMLYVRDSKEALEHARRLSLL
ncbi:MAG TPA: DinB family protein [Thermoanaerobaculia bacterium]